MSFARPVSVAFAPIVFAALSGCPASSDEDAATACGLDVWARPAAQDAHVYVVGSWDGWKRPGLRLEASGRADGARHVRVPLAAGPHRYALVEDGVERPDPLVPTTAWEGTREVTWVHVEACGAPRLSSLEATSSAEGGASLTAKWTGSGVPDLERVVVTLRGGARAEVKERTFTSGTLRLVLAGLGSGKASLLVSVPDTAGRTAEARTSVWTKASLERADWIFYQVIVDRFENEAGRLAPPTEPAGRAGGTLVGLRKAIERGDFSRLGVNALWLSPLYANPGGTFPGAAAGTGKARAYSAYHGYWPVDARRLEAALGREEDLDALVAAAHARGLRVVFDVVPNHVHQSHPYWATRTSDDGWNRPDGACLCGSAACPWATSIEQCWFAPYLPDVDLRHEPSLERAVSDVMFWLDRFDGDGLRVDAVPMMPRSAVRRMAAAARERATSSQFLVGETFTSEGGWDAIKWNLGPAGLDGQFHFPLMWSLRKAIAQESLPMSAIADALAREGEALAGSGAVMATMIGNHDVTRFASESDGTAAGDGFSPAPTPTDANVYAKQALAERLLLALPGAPVLYYGDELVLPGRADPDSRRTMPREDEVPAAALAVRDAIARAAALRSACAPLRRAGVRVAFSSREVVAFARDDLLVIASRRPARPGVPEPLAVGLPPGDYVDALAPSGPTFRVDASGVLSVPLETLALRVLVPTRSPCATP